jgi:hypothetical protein
VFRFEVHWPYMTGFTECIQHAWDKPVAPHHNAMMVLHKKLSRVAKALTIWARGLMPQGKLATAICREVISQLEAGQERRLLLDDEQELLKQLKRRLLGLATIERSRAHQRARLKWLRKGDVNTRYFHIMANMRKKNNYIVPLSNNVETATAQHDKQRLLFNHYQEHIGSCFQRRHLINLQALNWSPRNLSHLVLPFIVQQVQTVVKSMPKIKAPGPDGYIGVFFRSC